MSLSKISDSDLLAILETVNDYWDDGFRPALTSFSCEAVGGTFAMAIDAGVMFTLASAGFGIHDDIIDKTATKHSRKTIPRLFGVDKALLAGDLLILKASTIVQEIIQKDPSVKIADILKAYELHYTEICEAEFIGVTNRGNIDIGLEKYEKMLWKSTADSEACGRIGAILGNGSKQEVDSLAKFGRKLGFYRRLLGDLRDCLNVEGNLPHRLKNETIPLPILYAAKSSSRIKGEIRSILSKTEINDADFQQLLNFTSKTGAFAYMHKIAKKNCDEAAANLTMLKPSLARHALSLLNVKFFVDIHRLCL